MSAQTTIMSAAISASVRFARRHVLAAVALLLWAVSAGPAMAACVTSSGAVAFASSSSYAVRGGQVTAVSGAAGLACTGSTLSLLGGSFARATVTSTGNFIMTGPGGDSISYNVSADSGGTQVFSQGGTIDYMNPVLLSLLGIGSANNFNAPLYARLTASPNVRAGTYADKLTIIWDYAICRGLQITFVCLGYEADRKTVTVDVTLTVEADCRVSAPPLSFGSAALVSQFAQVQQAVLVDCTKQSSYRISFSAGQDGAITPWRNMKDGAGHVLQYNIYQPDGVTVWGPANPLTSAVLGTGATTPTQVQSYVARINPAQTTPPAGTYSDTVSVVVAF